jgi:hypothetical protein
VRYTEPTYIVVCTHVCVLKQCRLLLFTQTDDLTLGLFVHVCLTPSLYVYHVTMLTALLHSAFSPFLSNSGASVFLTLTSFRRGWHRAGHLSKTTCLFVQSMEGLWTISQSCPNSMSFRPMSRTRASICSWCSPSCKVILATCITVDCQLGEPLALLIGMGDASFILGNLYCATMRGWILVN